MHIVCILQYSYYSRGAAAASSRAFLLFPLLYELAALLRYSSVQERQGANFPSPRSAARQREQRRHQFLTHSSIGSIEDGSHPPTLTQELQISISTSRSRPSYYGPIFPQKVRS